MDDNTKELGIISKEYVNDTRVYIKNVHSLSLIRSYSP
jgi:hypothetical protein